jgi:periplasmic mercuric ion binding protein|tara:strand:+ start:98 stop:439 length:342 start_codon:yes stop_codon:yes gene_type:complete
MKTIIALIAISTLISCSSIKNGEVSKEIETFGVQGNCGMCKATIEKSLQDVPGIYWSEWDIDSQEVTVKFDSKKISLDNIQSRIAKVGYDNNSHRANEEVYNSLPACCKYERL